MEIKKDFTDQSLIQSLRSDANPDEAIRFLYRTQFRLTAAYIKQNRGTEEDAEDIFQELVLVFIEILKKDKFRGESSVSTFLYALTRNIWLNELNKRGKSKLRDENFEKSKDKVDMDVSHLIVDRETKSQMMQVVDKLGDTCKKILLAFYFENLAMKEILQTLNYENEQVVRNKKYKCLKQLEQMMIAEPNLLKNLKSVLL
ncbi:MAG TPA: sigma-70 family RNA polymerase sigma factor [Chitinophagaceae bacterium]|jgi:RNA polymerase sigma factor (sigma-70 family)|nr:sigma-70 family RNA polymerase sigma factor [Chitinophagaceae bacterium]